MFRQATPAMGLFALVCLGLTLFHQFHGLDRPAPGDPVFQAAGSAAVVAGRIVSGPEARLGKTLCVVRASAVNDKPVRGRVLIEYDGDAFPASAWDQILAAGTLSPVPEPASGSFNRRKFLASQNIHCLLPLHDPFSIRVIQTGRPPWLWRGPERVRRAMTTVFSRHFSPEKAAVISGITVGEKPHLFPELARRFKKAGVMHVLVASGTNVWFALGLWLAAARWLGAPRLWALGLGLGVSCFYALLAGGDPPVVRAAVMVSALILSALIGRGAHPWHSLSLAGLFLLAWEPRSILQAGFQMSFAATAGLIGFSPLYQGVLSRFFSRRFLWLKAPVQLLAATTAAQLALLPIMLFHFGEWPIAGLFSNLLVVPLAGVCLGLGFLLFAVSFLSGAAESAVAWVLNHALELLIRLVQFFGN